jgi:hypothetical protein
MPTAPAYCERRSSATVAPNRRRTFATVEMIFGMGMLKDLLHFTGKGQHSQGVSPPRPEGWAPYGPSQR